MIEKEQKRSKRILNGFWSAFNESRCKTAMLVISILITLIYGITVIGQIPTSGLREIVLIILTFWFGRASKAAPRK